MAFGLGPVIVVKRPAQNLDPAAMPFAGLGFGQAHLRQFGVGVRHPRDYRAGLHRQSEQRVADDEPGVITRHMGELQPARHIANRIDFVVAGLQANVDGDALFREGNSSRLQIEFLDIGLASGGDQQMRAMDGAVVPGFDCHAIPGLRHPLYRRAGENPDAFGFEPFQDDGGEFRIVLGQRLEGLDDGHFRSQPPVRLRHLHADRSTADDEKMARQHLIFKQVFVGEIGNVFQPRNGRRQSPRSGGDHQAPGRVVFALGLDGQRIAKPRRRPHHFHTELLETLLAVIGGDRRDGAPHMGVDLGKIDLGFLGSDAEALARPHGMGLLCRRQQRLRGNAAIVEAVAAHQALFEQHDALPELRRGGGHRQPAGARPDHRQIVIGFRHACRPFQALRATGNRATSPRPTKASSSSLVTSAPTDRLKLQLAAPFSAIQA